MYIDNTSTNTDRIQQAEDYFFELELEN